MRKIRQFIKNEKGAVFIIIALCFVSMMGITAAALDYSRGSLLQSELTSALDSAALAGGTVANSSTLNATVTKYFNVNMPAGYMGSTVDAISISQPSDKSTLTVSTAAHLQDAMMQVVGWNMTNVAASSQVTIEKKGMELVLVLDNTGSMTAAAGGGQSKLQALQTASNSLLNILYGTHDKLDNLWVSVVPFSQAVNIGTTRSGWTTGLPSYTNTGTSWRGCVEARETSGRDVTDDPPSVAKFAPYYSACVPWSSSSVWYNSWYGTTNSTNALTLGYSSSPSITFWTGCTNTTHYTTPIDTIITISSGNNAGVYNYGPNQYCPTTPILPMTASKTTVANTINSMKANGDTDINLGLVWGWRLLSPRWRYGTGTTSLWGGDMDISANPPTNNSPTKAALPLDYNTPLMNKVVILLTDGDNQMLDKNYTAYGLLSSGRVGATTTPGALTKLDAKTTAVCNSLKANGVTIYTIALGTAISSDGKALLQGCASYPEYYFASPTGADLQDAFTEIGDSLSNLRISQ